ncbi:MAG: hypothetical protein WD401_05025 [Thermomicrobiaceae bacterium]
MNQFRGTTFAFGHWRPWRIKVDTYWIAAALALASVSGYFLPLLFFDDPNSLARFGGALALPLGISASLLAFEAIRYLCERIFTTTATSSARRLYPTGSIETGFVLPESPRLEFRREALPPITLILLATSVVFIAEFLGALPVVQIGLRVFALVAGGVALLNVLPAMPFAGGRILKAIFWYLHDDHLAGSRVAFFYGQLTTLVGLGFGGIFLVWTPASILPGIWCLMLSWLVFTSSRNELTRSRLIYRAETVAACDAVAGLNPTLRASARLTDAIDILLEQHANGPALVRDRTVYSGTLSLDSMRDIPRSSWTDMTVQEAAIPLERLPDSPHGANLLCVLRLVNVHHDRPVIVRDERGRICGLIDATMEPGMLLRRGISRDVRLSRPTP